jgi:hypothetical protein
MSEAGMEYTFTRILVFFTKNVPDSQGARKISCERPFNVRYKTGAAIKILIVLEAWGLVWDRMSRDSLESL